MIREAETSWFSVRPGSVTWVRGLRGLLIPYQGRGDLGEGESSVLWSLVGSSRAADCSCLAKGVSNAQRVIVAPRNTAFLSSYVQDASCKTLPYSY